MARRRKGGGGLATVVIALLILLGGAGAGGYIYYKRVVLAPRELEEARLNKCREAGRRAKELFYKANYEGANRAAQEAIDVAPEQTVGYFWSARRHLRLYQEGHHWPTPWSVGGVLRFTPPVPDPPEVAEEAEQAVKDMREVLNPERKNDLMGAWARTCAEGIIALLSGDPARAEEKLAETLTSVDADVELQIYLAISRILQKKFEAAAEGLEPHLGRLDYIDAKVIWAKALHGQGLKEQLAGGDPRKFFGKALDRLKGLSSPRAAAARSEILTDWGKYLDSRGFGRREVLSRYEEAQKQGEPLSAAMGKVAHADWLVEHGQAVGAEKVLTSAVKTLEQARTPGVLNLNLLLRLAVAKLGMIRYLVDRGKSKEAAAQAGAFLPEIESAMAARDTDAGSKLALGIYRSWIQWTAAADSEGRMKAARSAEALAKQFPKDPWPAVEAAKMFRLAGDQLALQGGEAASAYGSAISAAGDSLALKSDLVEALVTRAAAYIGVARLDQREGRSPLDALDQAEKDLAAAEERNDRMAQIFRLRGIAQDVRAQYLALSGRDPAPVIQKAITEFGKALAIRSDWAEVYLDRARAWFTLGQFQAEKGDPETAFDRADEDLSRALDVRSGMVEALSLRAQVRLARGLLLRNRGKTEEAVGLFEKAVEDVSSAIRYRSEYASGHRIRGQAKFLIADLVASKGGDPRKRLLDALADLEKARKGTRDAVAHSLAGRALLRLGMYRQSQGNDPSADYNRAIEALDRALDINKRLPEAYIARGLVKTYAAEFVRRQGRDPTGQLQEAVEDFGRALSLRAGDPRALLGRGRARHRIGLQQRLTGTDPEPAFREAIRDLDAALAGRPPWPDALAARAGTWADLAEARLSRGQDPAREIEAALNDADGALRIAVHHEEALLAKVRALRVRGRLQAMKGERKLTGFETSAEAARTAAKANPRSARARRELARTLLRWSWFLEQKGLSGVSQYKEGLKAAEEGLAIDAGDPSLQRLKGWALGLEATHLRVAGAVPTKPYQAAIEELDRAVTMNNRDYRSLCRRAETLLGWVVWHRNHNEMKEAQEKTRKAFADLEEAARIVGRNDALPCIVRGFFYRKIGEEEKADQSFREAISICRLYEEFLRR